MAANKEIVKRVEAIYKWLDEQIAANRTKAGECGACGKCCDFELFSHRLFVTTPEMIYFRSEIGGKNHRVTARAGSPCYKSGQCPYQSAISTADGETSPKGGGNGKCTVYPYRFASCRIFCCKGDARFQSELTEDVVKKFKSLCEEFQIPYCYLDLPTALQNFTAENAEEAEYS
jgi:hypothetical protein